MKNGEYRILSRPLGINVFIKSSLRENQINKVVLELKEKGDLTSSNARDVFEGSNILDQVIGTVKFLHLT